MASPAVNSTLKGSATDSFATNGSVPSDNNPSYDSSPNPILSDVTSTLSDFSDFDGHEQVLLATDPGSGLRAMIAVHDTTLGPALGGCRMWPYKCDDEALTDVVMPGVDGPTLIR